MRYYFTRFVKSSSHNALAAPKKQDTIIYTEIIPKNMRKKEEVSKVTVVANVALDYNSLTLCAYRPVVFIYRILKLTCVSYKILTSV